VVVPYKNLYALYHQLLKNQGLAQRIAAHKLSVNHRHVHIDRLKYLKKVDHTPIKIWVVGTDKPDRFLQLLLDCQCLAEGKEDLLVHLEVCPTDKAAHKVSALYFEDSDVAPFIQNGLPESFFVSKGGGLLLQSNASIKVNLSPEIAEKTFNYETFDYIYFQPECDLNLYDQTKLLQIAQFNLKATGLLEVDGPDVPETLPYFFDPLEGSPSIYRKTIVLPNIKAEHRPLMDRIQQAFITQLGNFSLQQKAEHQQLGEELEAYNHELEATNEELSNINREVVDTYNMLAHKNQLLQANDELLNTIFNTADIGIAIFNVDGLLDRCNEVFSKTLGYRGQDISQKHFHSFFHLTKKDALKKVFKQVTTHNTQQQLELQAITQQGRTLEVSLSCSSLQLKGERFFLISLRDITQQRKTFGLLSTTLSSLKIGGWEYDIPDSVFSCTPGVYEVYEKTKGQELEARQDNELFEAVKGFDNYLIEEIIEKVLEEKGKYDAETELTTVKGNRKWVRITAKPFFIDGKIAKVYGTIQDITEAKLTAEKMAQSERLYQTLAQHFPGGTIDLIDRDLNYIFTGGQELQDLPQNPQEVIGKNIYKIYPQELAVQLEHYCQSAFSGETITFDIAYNGKYWNATATPLADQHGEIDQIMLLTQNITEKRMADLTLQDTHKSLSDFRLALDFASYVVITKANGEITYVNENFAQLTGLESPQLTGKSFSEIAKQEEQQGDFTEIYQQVMEGKIWKGELMGQAMNGSKFWLKTVIVPFKDQEGKPYQILSISSDITEQKQAETLLKKRNEDLTKINAELDRFVYSASHDLRAPLVSILGLLNVVKVDPDEQSRNMYFDMMEKSVNKLDRFVQEIIHYSRNSRLEVKTEEIDLKALFNEVFDSLKHIQGAEKVELQIEIEQTTEKPFISDSSRLSVIFNNLISNAINYRSRRHDHPYIRLRATIKADQAVLVISDNGLGISAEYRHRVFDMFFRATEDTSVSGSGLGLYIVKESIDMLEGQISLESEQNVGTSFTITLPNQAN